ncbi:MAG: transposase family protein, partial [Gammaproteobacteria bacterium]|nr:transposase family protein [Gammaproteobacteria bacterium]
KRELTPLPSEELKNIPKELSVRKDVREHQLDTWVSPKNSEMQLSQEKDDELSPIIELLKNSPKHVLEEKLLGYYLDEGVLYFSDGMERGKLVVPKEYRQLVCCEHHSLPTGGHFGSKKTLAAIRTKYFWPLMVRQIRNYCRTCEVCAARSGQQRRSKPKLSPLPLVEEPMDRVGMDVLKLPMSANGNNHVLVLQDYMTKYLFAYPVLNETAEEIGKLLVSRFFANFGLPKELLTDRGSAF